MAGLTLKNKSIYVDNSYINKLNKNIYMDDYHKFFTLEEARELMNEVKERMEMAKKLNNSLTLLKSIQIEQDGATDTANLAILEYSMKQYKLLHMVFKELFELAKKGAIVKDLEEGLVDFYSRFEGREIFLCWKYGEKTIEYWHDIDDGYQGRKHVSLLNSEIED